MFLFLVSINLKKVLPRRWIVVMNIGIVKQLISDHEEWKVNCRSSDSLGLAYDVRSPFYSIALLP
jgi:hypothetical protein